MRSEHSTRALAGADAGSRRGVLAARSRCGVQAPARGRCLRLACEARRRIAKQAPRRRRHALDKNYPHYRAARAELAHRDPARPFQRRVDLLRLAESPRQLLLFVAHAWGGGVRSSHGRAGCVDRRTLRCPPARAGRGRCRQIVVAEVRRRLRGVFFAAAARCRRWSRCSAAGPGAHPFPSCAWPAADSARAAARDERALRLHAARLLPDLPAIPPGHGGGPLLRRTRRRGVCGLHQPPPEPVGNGYRRVARGFSLHLWRRRLAYSRRRTTSRSASRATFRTSKSRCCHMPRTACGIRASCACSRWARSRRRRACAS